MKSSDFRAEARSKMTGKWGKAALIAFLYSLFFFLLGFVQGLFPESYKGIFSLLTLVIEIPLAYGLIVAFFKLYNSEEIGAFEFFKLGFNSFSKSWSVTFNMLLKLLIPVILLVVSIFLIAFGATASIASAFAASYYGASTAPSGAFLVLAIIGLILYIVSIIWTIVKSFYYSLSYVILADKLELTGKQAVEESKKLMTGNRGKLFGLQLSFFGWALLAVLTLGIGYFWLLPYMQFSIFAFYKKLSENNTTVETVTDNNEKIGE